MGRLGDARRRRRDPARPSAAAATCELEGLMTHFASSADYTSAPDRAADRGFRCGPRRSAAGRDRSRPVCTCPAPTPLPTGGSPAWGNMVRAGHALYGYVSPAKGDAPPRILDVKPALALEGRHPGGEGPAGGDAGRLRRHLSRRAADAHRRAGGGLRGRRSAPHVEPGQGDRRRAARAGDRRGLDGPDHHRHHRRARARAGRCGDAARTGGRRRTERPADRPLGGHDLLHRPLRHQRRCRVYV